VLETRTKNIQASRSRTDQFVSSVSARSQPQFDASRSESPLYQNTTPNSKRTPYTSTNDLLTLEPSGPSALMSGGGHSESQLLLMEEAQAPNTYIQERGQAIETIERTINELGSIFGQLAGMVQEQGEQLQRIDANTEDVVDNVQGAQRELLKYWNRVQGNRWLVAKMFGVLMVGLLSQCSKMVLTLADILPLVGSHIRLDLCTDTRRSGGAKQSSAVVPYVIQPQRRIGSAVRKQHFVKCQYSQGRQCPRWCIAGMPRSRHRLAPLRMRCSLPIISFVHWHFDLHLEDDCGGLRGWVMGRICVLARISDRIGNAMGADSLRMILPMPMKRL
jgi:hypothetical protein